MPEPELHVRDLTPPLLVTACETGRHVAHYGETCEEIDELQAVFRAYLERSLTQAYARAMAETEATLDRLLITGDGTGAPIGFLAMPDVSGPGPGERAFAILEPHLTDVTLYRPKFARGGILPKGFGAIADAPLCQPRRLPS